MKFLEVYKLYKLHKCTKSDFNPFYTPLFFI